MSGKNNIPEKQFLHPRNKNRQPYDLAAMVLTTPELAGFIQPNKLGKPSVNFSDPTAIRLLNKAILHHYYGIAHWDFPAENLCPPIPGRAEYIHLLADLLSESNQGNIPKGSSVTCLDIGVGASCIYPIIGVTEYGWHFTGTDIDPASIKSARQIVRLNPVLKNNIICKVQSESNHIFKGILQADDKIDAVICNPPFHASAAEARKGTQRKVKNLTGRKARSVSLNHSGNATELIYEGGEVQFLSNMITESKIFRKQCFWFTSLVSKKSNLKKIEHFLHKANPTTIRTLSIKTGNKTSHILAWTFFTAREQNEWYKG